MQVTFDAHGIAFAGSPFPPASVYPYGRLAYSAIRDVDPDAAPPEVRTLRAKPCSFLPSSRRCSGLRSQRLDLQSCVALTSGTFSWHPSWTRNSRPTTKNEQWQRCNSSAYHGWRSHGFVVPRRIQCSHTMACFGTGFTLVSTMCSSRPDGLSHGQGSYTEYDRRHLAHSHPPERA
jgi:hypothetical protein